MLEESTPVRRTTLDDVCAFLELMASLGIDVWIDGGWAVDAWLGRETRPHGDLDIEVESGDLRRLVDALRSAGYDEVPRDDSRPWNFVLGDGQGREIDVHVLEITAEGEALYGPPEARESWAPEALAGRTTLCGRDVRAIPPAWLVRFHTGYEIDADDRADVRALCERFGIPLPPEYRDLA